MVLLLPLLLHIVAAKLVDLQPELRPKKFEETGIRSQSTKSLVEKRAQAWEQPTFGESTGRKPVGNKTVAVGSSGQLFHDGYDKGFLSTVLAAYANHWTLVTGPEDWWFTIIRRLAMAIDLHSKKQKVRNFFVSHEGKKELVVILGSNIYSPDYNGFFQQMTDLVADNLKKPQYVSSMRPNFSTTGPKHLIAANVAIMSSLQEYFSYTGGILCGVPRVEMKGTEQDWRNLLQKFRRLSNLMNPIKADLELSTLPSIVWRSREVVDWWSSVDTVLSKLVDTYRGNPDLEWWKEIIRDESSSGCGGPVIDIQGWFMSDLLVQSYEEASSGLGSVPLKLTDGSNEEQAAVVAGIAGFTVKPQQDGNYSVEASHDWALMLLPNSGFRHELAEWETNGVD